MNTPSKTLVIGATGRFARLVVPELHARGATIRALIRDPSKLGNLSATGPVELAVGDLRDGGSISAALQDVSGVFYLGPAFAPDEAAMGTALVRAAIQRGVQKFVFSSVNQPTNVHLANHASKIPVEEALYNSKLEYTILHPGNFMQNFTGAWRSIVDSGVFAEPFSKTARIARVDYRDVAEVAAIALTTDRLKYASLELFSDGIYSREDVAGMMTGASGKPITAAEISFEEWQKRSGLAYSEEQFQVMSKVFDYYDKFGLGGNSVTLRAALGREPRTLRKFIDELASGV